MKSARAFSLFESFLGNDVEVLKQTVETLGRLPDPWWGAFEERGVWFEENGQPMSEQDQDRAGVLLTSHRTSIRMKLLEIGEQDNSPSEDKGPMIENFGVRLPEEEVDLLADLLQKMLKYNPEERICIQDVIRHPWFTMRFFILHPSLISARCLFARFLSFSGLATLWSSQLPTCAFRSGWLFKVRLTTRLLKPVARSSLA